MKPVYLVLEDGAVFRGQSVSDDCKCSGLLSFYTGVVGYQEVVTDPANLGKIILFTYPLIGNYGVNGEDAESQSPKAAGLLAKEYPPYYSNFRAEGNLKDYLAANGTVFADRFDTRAIMLHLREHGEMRAAVTDEEPADGDASGLIGDTQFPEYQPENQPQPCPEAAVKAAVVDLGASKSFFKHLAALGVDASAEPDDAELIIVSDAPYYAVENQAAVDRVKDWVGRKPVIGFGHGSAIAAKACGAAVERMKFGDHGVNVPVRYTGGGRNEITVQNHNYVVKPDSSCEALFENVHDGTCEGFVCRQAAVCGANFLPNEDWFRALLDSLSIQVRTK